MRFDSLFVFVDARAVIIVQGECNRVHSNCRAAADNVKEKHALRKGRQIAVYCPFPYFSNTLLSCFTAWRALWVCSNSVTNLEPTITPAV